MNVAISEALAAGLPVIATKHSGFPDQVIDGKNGFLVEEGNFKELADKILYFMNHSELWSDFGRFGRQHVEKNYNNDLLIKKQIDFYLSILNSQ